MLFDERSREMLSRSRLRYQLALAAVYNLNLTVYMT